MIDTITRSYEKNPGKARIKSARSSAADPLPASNDGRGFAARRAGRRPPASEYSAQPKRCTPAWPQYVAAADELLMTWMDSAEGLTRDGVVDVVMLLFDATAHHISST